MSITRDNELRALERMRLILTMSKTVFPADRELMLAWFYICEEINTLIDKQEESIKRFNKDLT